MNYESKKHSQRLFRFLLPLFGVVLGVCTYVLFTMLIPSYLLSAFIPYPDPTGMEYDPNEFTSTEGVNTGTTQLANMLRTLINFVKYIVGLLAFIWFVWSGIRMVSAGDKEEEAKNARDGATHAVIALMLVVLAEPLIVNTLYGGGGTIDPGEQLKETNISGAIMAGHQEVLAVMQWVKAITVLLAVGFLVFSAWRFLQDIGGEEEISKQKYVLMWIGVGLVVIAIDEVLIDEILYKRVLVGTEVEYSPDAPKGIQEFAAIMKYFLQFVAAIALGVMVYGGFLMITSFTNEENVERGKKILINSGIGFVVIIVSYILVSSLITGRVS